MDSHPPPHFNLKVYIIDLQPLFFRNNLSLDTSIKTGFVKLRSHDKVLNCVFTMIII